MQSAPTYIPCKSNERFGQKGVIFIRLEFLIRNIQCLSVRIVLFKIVRWVFCLDYSCSERTFSSFRKQKSSWGGRNVEQVDRTLRKKSLPCGRVVALDIVKMNCVIFCLFPLLMAKENATNLSSFYLKKKEKKKSWKSQPTNTIVTGKQ